MSAHRCSNPDCQNTVKTRRPSKSGDHWCPSRDCQAMKQRQLRSARRREQMLGRTVDDDRMAFFKAALHQPRQQCPRCDLADGITGYIHRASPGSRQTCDGLGSAGIAVGRLWIDAAHPDRVTS